MILPSTPMKFFIVDAFTESILGGNTAGVVILPIHEDFPIDNIMQQTAAELRYSETAFVKQLSNTEFQIRYFTPAGEVDLCGHATIASFKVLSYLGIISDNATYINHTIAGKLFIQLVNNNVFMDMATPQFISEIINTESLESLYHIMGLSYQEQLNKGLHYTPQIISTGLPDIMLPLQTLDDLNSINPDYPTLSKLSEHYHVVGVHAFTLDASDVTSHVRNFAPRYDINEEAATGTSNGALTYYGYRNGLISNHSDCTFIQGEKMQRPSLIHSHISDDGKSVKIQVGGTAAILAEGNIRI